jgi:phosphoadenosine phosphosulfate reductase
MPVSPAPPTGDPAMAHADAVGDPASTIARLRARFANGSAIDVLEFVLRGMPDARAAVVSSFGADSAVLLHMVSRIDRTTPVLFLNTKRHFPETLRYRDTLSSHLALQNVCDVEPSLADEATLDPHGALASSDPDGCCTFRKTLPLRRALSQYDLWISGRKRYQAVGRRDIEMVELDAPWIKVNPLAAWDAGAIRAYIANHALPHHPLIAQGYLSIGCAPCTSTVRPGEDERAGRWRGREKTECGIHLDSGDGQGHPHTRTRREFQ